VFVAEQMGLTGDAAKSYASDMVQANLDEAGSDDMIRKAESDLSAKGVAITTAALKVKIEEFANLAKEQVMTETT
jgi:hypothetical protein